MGRVKELVSFVLHGGNAVAPLKEGRKEER
jgi:hypothetical protein